MTETTSHSERFRPDVVLIDGRHLLFRAADAHSTLEAVVGSDLVPTGGVYGLLTVLVKLRRRYGGRYMMCWEGEGNFRYQLFKDYKRREPPTEAIKKFRSDLMRQEKLIRSILSKLGVRQYESVGGEADDVIGTLATKARAAELSVAIFSGDGDLHQLVDERTQVIRPEKRKEVVYDYEGVVGRWGVRPDQLPDLKALMGDSSDAIPGVPGVGEKTAVKLINEYGDLEGVIKAAREADKEGWVATERYRKLVKEHAEQTRLYLKLTTIRRDMKLKGDPVDRDPLAARKQMKDLKFRRLLEAGNFTDLKALAG